jgi:LytS/YehU family sensor histidine kinase
MLVYQVNPHFLFNTLNSVRALAAEDPERTRAMVTRLAEFLRAALDADPLAPASLGRELDAAAAYLAIEQVRFGARLRATVDATPEARAAAVPGFLLHPLVENAVTHGRGAAPGGPLHVAVRAWCADGRLTVDVCNGGTLAGGTPAGAARTAPGAAGRRGIGVANVRERLALLYGDAAALTLTQDGATVRARLTLPLAPPLAPPAAAPAPARGPDGGHAGGAW